MRKSSGQNSLLDRAGWEDLEQVQLADWAIHSSQSQGRSFPEPDDDLRTCFQRDRDRIIHCQAFRRLEYKTQVFINHEGDHYRTRLTHTLEVAQIARAIARVLRLNVDLTEAIALAHDIGHTPFGHAGEAELGALMKDHGGFEHNEHGLRVVDCLERRYEAFLGLNLSYEVREGIIKHSGSYDSARPGPWAGTGGASLESQVVDRADEIAYNSHDLDDGVASDLLPWDRLEGIALWKRWASQAAHRDPETPTRFLRPRMTSALIHAQVTDLVKTSHRELLDRGVQSPEDVRSFPGKLIQFSPEMDAMNAELKSFLMKNLYRHHRVMRMTTKARKFLSELFGLYVSRPELMPPTFADRMASESAERVVCDYIAGMTDRYALDEYRKLFMPWEKI